VQLLGSFPRSFSLGKEDSHESATGRTGPRSPGQSDLVIITERSDDVRCSSGRWSRWVLWRCLIASPPTLEATGDELGMDGGDAGLAYILTKATTGR